MSLHYILDGYNLIKHRLFAPHIKAQDSRQSLLAFISQEKPCGSSRNRVTVVFDGYDDTKGLLFGGAIEVVFTHQSSADARICGMVESEPQIRNTIVVTDDNDIRSWCRAHGAGIRGVEEFIAPAGRKRRVHHDDASEKLTYTQMQCINSELRKRWL